MSSSRLSMVTDSVIDGTVGARESFVILRTYARQPSLQRNAAIGGHAVQDVRELEVVHGDPEHRVEFGGDCVDALRPLTGLRRETSPVPDVRRRALIEMPLEFVYRTANATDPGRLHILPNAPMPSQLGTS